MNYKLLTTMAEECINGDQFPLAEFAKRIIDDCLTAIDSAEKPHVHTTFDQSQHECSLVEAKKSIKKHFGIDEG